MTDAEVHPEGGHQEDEDAGSQFANDGLCSCQPEMHFKPGEGNRVELVGLSPELLMSTPLNDLKLNFDGSLVDVYKIHPERCAVEFEVPANCLSKVPETDPLPVEVMVGKRKLPRRVEFHNPHLIGATHNATVIGVTHVDEEEEEATLAPTSFAAKQERFLSILRGDRARRFTLLEQCVAEFIGTAFISIFGVGSVCTAVLTGAQVGIFQIAVVWGFGVAFAIYSTASISGAHLNPAVSLAFALFRPLDFPWNRLLPFWTAQLLGGIGGAAVNFGIWRRWYDFFDPDRKSVFYAATFGEYFPNPGAGYIGEFADPQAANSLIYPAENMLVEAWGTGILMFMILVFTDDRNRALVNKDAAPFLIGFTVTVLISLYAPIQQAGWNPARDFGPRIVAWLAGWGSIAIPGPRKGFWTYIVGPLLGAPLGAFVYDVILARGLREPPTEEDTETIYEPVESAEKKSEKACGDAKC